MPVYTQEIKLALFPVGFHRQSQVGSARRIQHVLFCYHPHIGFFKHLFQHSVKFFPIVFAGIAVQAIGLHRFYAHVGIGEEAMHPFSQLR